ncbi:hypothetical protein PSA01_15040 [Pseudonocardia saturnea]|uniref:Uncharacterized protein n=1 Tax=Pseudonocardia saturnea TaxID=33909 RepID=A0ABQ0RUX8_9PSEU|nr:hypothetical protein Pdca_26280 [Pseudonocardia autotrophica]GEC24475.1 hypothetical protein PSA01_15040 [Pseudonocardia saturnea]
MQQKHPFAAQTSGDESARHPPDPFAELLVAQFRAASAGARRIVEILQQNDCGLVGTFARPALE